MKKLGIASLLGAFVVSSLVMFATSAWAVPVFARKYNVACSLCHTLPPRLTKAGVAFKENGFEMPSAMPQSDRFGNAVLAEDEPRAEVPAGLPLTIRTGLDILFSGSASPSLGAASSTAIPAAGFREFGLIGGGNVGGVGFWIDAPGAALGAFDLDFKFSDLAKLKVGVFQPAATINYGLGLQPAAVGGIGFPVIAGAVNNTIGNRNPISGINAGFTFNDVNAGPTLELRGTTDATNGMGFNYSVGYAMAPGGTFTANAQNSIYGGIGYLVDSINTNFGVSYASTSNIAGLANDNGSTLLATATVNVGDPLQVIIAYNSTSPGSVSAPGVTASGWSIQPEYSFDKFWIGGRYSTQSITGGAASPSEFRVGAGYRILQNLIGSLSFTSLSNNNHAAPSAANPDVSAVYAILDVIL